MENLLESKSGDINADNAFVVRYQATTHALGQMKDKTLENAQNWLKANEERYNNLTKNNK
jgi:tryptophanyl-tRNA synthetase